LHSFDTTVNIEEKKRKRRLTETTATNTRN